MLGCFVLLPWNKSAPPHRPDGADYLSQVMDTFKVNINVTSFFHCRRWEESSKGKCQSYKSGRKMITVFSFTVFLTLLNSCSLPAGPEHLMSWAPGSRSVWRRYRERSVQPGHQQGGTEKPRVRQEEQLPPSPPTPPTPGGRAPLWHHPRHSKGERSKLGRR